MIPPLFRIWLSFFSTFDLAKAHNKQPFFFGLPHCFVRSHEKKRERRNKRSVKSSQTRQRARRTQSLEGGAEVVLRPNNKVSHSPG